MTRILAIDPGSEQSAWLLLVDGAPAAFAIEPNDRVLFQLAGGFRANDLVIEKIESYGMAVGREVFETVFWSGRFTQAALPFYRVRQLARRAVKVAICGDTRAKDGNIRQALIDRFGGQVKGVGTTKARGPLYGISKDVWSALAIAVTWAETEGAKP